MDACPLLLVGLRRERGSRLQRLFAADGWAVLHFPDAASCRAALASAPGGLALAACEPEHAPEEVLRALRDVPAIGLVSAECPSANACGIRWLEAGADFALDGQGDKLLLAKAQAHLRRLLPLAAGRLERLRSPSLMVDVERRTISSRRGRDWIELARLTETETRIFSYLAGRRGEVVAARDILDAVWGPRCGEVNAEIVCKYLSRLRAKLGPKRRALRSLYGKGYLFQDPG